MVEMVEPTTSSGASDRTFQVVDGAYEVVTIEDNEDNVAAADDDPDIFDAEDYSDTYTDGSDDDDDDDIIDGRAHVTVVTRSMRFGT